MRTALAAALVLTVPLFADDQPTKEPTAESLLATAQKQAKTGGRAVFLAFGSPGCVWCKHLDKYHERPAVTKLLGKHLVFTKVDTVKNPGGDDLYKKYAPKGGGVPVWVILSADGKVLADSFHEKEGNVGFPADPHEMDHYRAALKKALPKLSSSDLDAVMVELKEAQPKRKG